MHLYVYYDVPLASRSTARERLDAIRAELADGRARLMRRAEPRADSETWMEVYEGVDARFEARLDAAVARHGLAACTGPRRVERFVDLDAGRP